MSEIVSELDRAAAAYWRRLAQTGGTAKASAALSRAQQLTVEARAESRIPDRAQRPTLDQIEAPPLRLR
jgi:hypothetical protein